MSHGWFRSPTPRILAHRGFVPPTADGVAENSFAAIAAAHAEGVDYVESDCHVTADGVPVLFHDVDLQRLIGDPRPVAAVTAAEMEQSMSGCGGMVTVAQALTAFPTLRFNLDVKADAAAVPFGRVIAPHADRVLISSFSDDRRIAALASAREFGGYPATSAGTAVAARVVAAVTTGSSRLVGRALSGVDALQIPERYRGVRLVTRRLLDAVHRHGVEVHVWTVNDPSDMTRLLDAGVDGLVTDRCDLALSIVASRS